MRRERELPKIAAVSSLAAASSLPPLSRLGQDLEAFFLCVCVREWRPNDDDFPDFNLENF